MKRELKDGVYFDLPRAEYDSIRRLNWSRLKALARSPAHYRHGLFADHIDTDAMRLGRCAHMAVLEPEVFPKACAVWEGARRAGKEWEQFRALAEHDGREILKTAEVTYCHALQSAVRADPPIARRSRRSVRCAVAPSAAATRLADSSSRAWRWPYSKESAWHS